MKMGNWVLTKFENLNIKSESRWMKQIRGLFFVKSHVNEVNLCQTDTKRYSFLGRVNLSLWNQSIRTFNVIHQFNPGLDVLYDERSTKKRSFR